MTTLCIRPPCKTIAREDTITARQFQTNGHLSVVTIAMRADFFVAVAVSGVFSLMYLALDNAGHAQSLMAMNLARREFDLTSSVTTSLRLQ